MLVTQSSQDAKSIQCGENKSVEATSCKGDVSKLDSSAVEDKVKEDEGIGSYTSSELGQFWDKEEALLGGCSRTECSYKLGAVTGEALYVCMTCFQHGKKRAGIYFACAGQCHDGHDLNEIYTKRNFKCDCGNSPFPGVCKLVLIFLVVLGQVLIVTRLEKFSERCSTANFEN